MNINDLLHSALKLEFLSAEEGVFLFENATTAELMYVGNAIVSFAIFTAAPGTKNPMSLPLKNISKKLMSSLNLVATNCFCKGGITRIWACAFMWIYFGN